MPEFQGLQYLKLGPVKQDQLEGQSALTSQRFVHDVDPTQKPDLQLVLHRARRSECATDEQTLDTEAVGAVSAPVMQTVPPPVTQTQLQFFGPSAAAVQPRVQMNEG